MLPTIQQVTWPSVSVGRPQSVWAVIRWAPTQLRQLQHTCLIILQQLAANKILTHQATVIDLPDILLRFAERVTPPNWCTLPGRNVFVIAAGADLYQRAPQMFYSYLVVTVLLQLIQTHMRSQRKRMEYRP